MANGSGTYRTLFDLYVSGYRATSTSLRSKTENETIDAALSTFGGLTDKTDQEITRLGLVGLISPSVIRSTPHFHTHSPPPV